MSNPQPRLAGDPPDDWPELARLPREQQVQIWQQANADAGTAWLPWIFLLLFPGLVFTITIAERQLLGSGLRDLGVPGPLIRAASFFGTIGVLLVPIGVLLHRCIRRRVWQLVPHLCDGCGYDLTGNTSGRCPECGRRRGAAAPRVARPLLAP
jgi:hypothetical protein